MSKITKSAREQPCQIQLPGCPDNRETVVFCHSNELIHGKGVGLKSLEIFGAYGCQYCHDIVDRRRKPPEGMTMDEVMEYFRNGNARTVRILVDKELITCK